MTMTEPSSHSADTKTENGQTELTDFVSCEKDLATSSAVQEVNNVTFQSGGGSQPCEDGGPLMRNGGGDAIEVDDVQFEETPVQSEEATAAQLVKREVSFHEGIVAGWRDPPDPWKDVTGWTWQEVLKAYRKSCEKHTTKPLAKILQQIQGLVDNGGRQDVFTLKGEKLDHKHCESIEEILRRIQFRSIDLEASHLEDECAVALFDMIEFYDSACQLNISFNRNIGLRGWQACSRLIRRTPHLTHLDLRNCDLNERSIPIIGRALKLGSPLTVLHLENISLSGRTLVILVAALKMNETLQELFLADNKLMPSDGVQLGNLLKYNHRLELLDLRNNHLQDVGTGHLCDGLYEQNLDTGLKTLVMWSNQITYQSMSAISRALMSTECLETLNLGHNNITNEGMHILKGGLLKSKALLRLGLQGTKLTCEGAVALAEFVADSPRLVRLDLRENDIKTAGLMALSLAMRVNDTVVRMDLDKDTKKESGMKDYADQQRRLQQEILAYGEGNHRKSLERETQQRQQLQDRARDTAAQETAAQQSADDAVQAARDVLKSDLEYIPSAEKIPRPKLLFSNILAPQQSLESPGDYHGSDDGGGSGDDIPTSTAAVEATSSSTASSQKLSLCLPTSTRRQQPPADMLLSPQYIPRLTAKKIFSVNRVTETLPIAGQGEAPPTFNLLSVTTDPNTHNISAAISPTTLCHDLAAETVNEYIQQIVSEEAAREATRDNNPPIAEQTSDDVNLPETDGSVSAESENSVQSTESRDVVELNTNCNQYSKEDVPGESTITAGSTGSSGSVAVSDNGVCDHRDTCDNSTADGTTGNDDDVTGNIANSVTAASNIGNASSSPAPTENPVKALCVKSDVSGLNSDSEQWQKVDQTDLMSQLGQTVEQSTGGGVEKPDFHTNLTQNGLARELASALDSVDERAEAAVVTMNISKLSMDDGVAPESPPSISS